MQSFVELWSLQQARTELFSVEVLHWLTKFGSLGATSVPQRQLSLPGPPP
jgi:hypothetical protein